MHYLNKSNIIYIYDNDYLNKSNIIQLYVALFYLFNEENF